MVYVVLDDFGDRVLRRHNVRAITLIAYLCVFSLTACGLVSESSDSTTTPLPPVNVPELPDIASDAQRATVANYQRTGVLRYEDYKQSQLDYFACLEDAGFTVAWEERTVRGYQVIAASFGIPRALVEIDGSTATAEAVYMDCSQTHASVVAQIYETANFEHSMVGLEAAYGATLRECLADAGLAPESLAEASLVGLIGVANEQAESGRGDCVESIGLAAQLEDPPPPAPPPAP